MTNSGELRMRVWVEDAWDRAEFVATTDWTVKQLKEHALRTATLANPDPASYEVKLRGILVLDETRTLRDLDVVDLAPFIVLSARRRPVR
jgi:hypothetical protein